MLKLRARESQGLESYYMLKGQYDQDLIIQAILLNMICDYITFHESQISLHYEEACLLAILVSQLASNSSLEYTLYHTSNINIRIQSTLEHLSSLVLVTHFYLVVVIIYQLLIN